LGSGALAVWTWTLAEAAPVQSGAAVTATLLAGLSALGMVEHLFLVLPLRDAKLWQWASAKTKAAKVAAND
jgi:hypothetical protein